MFSVKGRSHVLSHVLILRIFGTLKKLRFRQNHEEVFNRRNSANWAELHKATYRGHGVKSRAGATCRGYGARLRAGDMQVAQSDLYLQMGGVVTIQTLQVKCRCQLVVRLKANKYYPELLNFLSSYINLLNLLNLKASAVDSWPLAGSKPLALDLDLKPLAILVFVLAFGQSFFSKVCHNPTALRWLARPWSLDWLFATSFVRDSGPLRNRSQLSSASPRSCLSGLLSNRAQLCITILDCPWLYQAVVCQVCRAIMRDFGRLVDWLVGQLLVQSVSTSIG